MTTQSDTQKQKANSTNSNKQLSLLKNNVFTMLAAFSGVVLGVLGSMGFFASYLHSQLANQTASLNRNLSMRNASLTSQCVSPSGGSGGAGNGSGVKTAAAVSNPAGGMGGGEQSGSNGPVFVHKLVSGIFGNTTGTISDTGQNSNNQIQTTNTNTTTVENHNKIDVVNLNGQYASSGDASAKKNTNAGSANTGDASNDNDSSTAINVNN